MPKDKEEERYVPPPPLPYVLMCPKKDCNKKYRQNNGLRFHVSHMHPEFMDELGNIRDQADIEKMEATTNADNDKKKDESKSGEELNKNSTNTASNTETSTDNSSNR